MNNALGFSGLVHLEDACDHVLHAWGGDPDAISGGSGGPIIRSHYSKGPTILW